MRDEEQRFRCDRPSSRPANGATRGRAITRLTSMNYSSTRPMAADRSDPASRGDEGKRAQELPVIHPSQDEVGRIVPADLCSRAHSNPANPIISGARPSVSLGPRTTVQS